MNSSPANIFMTTRKNFKGFEDNLFRGQVPSFLQDVARVRLNQSIAMKNKLTVRLTV